MHVQHPLIKPNSIESRSYQESILGTAIGKNTLVCVPTGLGKTNIAVLLTAHRLTKYPESKIMFCAPTKPLVVQHYNTFLRFMNIDEELFQVITGTIKPQGRAKLYTQKKLIFATPQTVQNDLENKRFSLTDFSLLVIDEMHHSVGNYAYPYISTRYMEESENPRILGLTASPGATKDKINEICKNTGIEEVEIRTEMDDDVTPYIEKKEIEWVNVELPETFLEIKQLLEKASEKRLGTLIKLRFLRTKKVSKTRLLELQKQIIMGVKKGDKRSFFAINAVIQAIKIEHSLTLLEMQSISVLKKYFEKLRKEKSRASKGLMNDKNISNAIYLTEKLLSRGSRHPKMSKLCSIIDKYFTENPDKKIIIFANFRDTVKEIVSVLENIKNAKPIEFVGQREGMTQKEQLNRLNSFRDGAYNILICTSIGEEGLDIANADIAIFYDNIASPLRNIQRRGRVGRTKIGKIIILITKHTRDEIYYFASRAKEKKMFRILHGLSKQNNLESF